MKAFCQDNKIHPQKFGSNPLDDKNEHRMSRMSSFLSSRDATISGTWGKEGSIY
jgi:hypothetical protein